MMICKKCDGTGSAYIPDPTAEKGGIENPYTIEEAEALGIDTDDVVNNSLDMLSLSKDEIKIYEEIMQEHFLCKECGGIGWK